VGRGAAAVQRRRASLNIPVGIVDVDAGSQAVARRCSSGSKSTGSAKFGCGKVLFGGARGEEGRGRPSHGRGVRLGFELSRAESAVEDRPHRWVN